MKIYYASLLLVIVFFITCCKRPSSRQNDINTTESVALNDYNMSAAPNAIDTVGFIFAVDKNRKQIPISTINIKARKGIIAVRASQSTRTSSWNALANFLGVPSTKITANAGIKDSSTVKTTIDFNKDLQMTEAPILDIDAALAIKEKEVSGLIKRRHLEAFTFYLIIQTIEAKKLVYKFDRNVIGNATLEANFQSVAKANSGLKWNKNNEFQLEFDLKAPLVVFYKALELNVVTSIGGDINIKSTDKPIVGKQGMLYVSK